MAPKPPDPRHGLLTYRTENGVRVVVCFCHKKFTGESYEDARILLAEHCEEKMPQPATWEKLPIGRARA